MTESQRVVIRKLATGVPGLDEVLGGGVPEYSFNLIAGGPGTGKTTLTQQIAFANATAERPAIFFTVLGEPPIKMLRYQQQFRFFDPARVGVDVRFLDLSDDVLHKDLGVVLDRIADEVHHAKPAMVAVDSFRTIVRAADAPGVSERDLQHFVQRLALRLTNLECTSFLLGEFAAGESREPVFTVADGVVWMINEIERNSSTRKLRVTKVRGQATLPGLHTMRITDAGVEVFPRQPALDNGRQGSPRSRRLSTGVGSLDAMMGGGIPEGDSVLITGPSGSGKTVLATQFAAEGARQGDSVVIAVFEERPEVYIARARSLGIDLGDMIARGKLDILYLRPLDLSVDETFHEIRERVRRIDARRVVIDSISGFEAALAPTFRQDFRESFYRLMGSLTSLNITLVSTMETREASDYLRFSPYNISFLTDDIIAMRYVEMAGEVRRVLAVVKMRGSDHGSELRAFDITSTGLEVGDALREYRGIITGVPERSHDGDEPPIALSHAEATLLDFVLRRGEVSGATLASESGLSREDLRLAIDRLAASDYLRVTTMDDERLYRASARALG